MKLVIVSDLHGQPKTLQYLDKILKREKPDGLIITGDITNRDDTSFLVELFVLFVKYELSAYLIWGNSDEAKAQIMIDSSAYSVNLKSRKAGDFNIYGISETDQPVIPDPAQVSGSILLTHRPPRSGVLNARLSNAPKYHINGHIHSRAYIKKYPSTIHIQVPTLQSGRYAIFYPKKESVKFLSI